MLALDVQTRCRKDIKLAKKRGKDLEKLWDIVKKLRNQELLPLRNKPHRLTGNWTPCWECHIEPDWLLIYNVVNNSLILFRTGTHSDLFE